MCWQDSKEPSGQNLNEEVPLRSKESGETTAPLVCRNLWLHLLLGACGAEEQAQGLPSVEGSNRKASPLANHGRQITFKRDAVSLTVEACRMIPSMCLGKVIPRPVFCIFRNIFLKNQDGQLKGVLLEVMKMFQN